MATWTTSATASLHVRERLRDQRGQSLVEFAIVLPVLLLIILGILYFGRYEDYANQETQLAEQAARFAAVDNNPSTTSQTLQAYVQSQAQPELANGSSDVTKAHVYVYYPSGSANSVGSPLTACVVTTVQYPFFGLAGNSETIAQSATMRIEVPWNSTTMNGSPDPLSNVPSSCPTS
jgi:Flp pilus assembly protein TadG